MKKKLSSAFKAVETLKEFGFGSDVSNILSVLNKKQAEADKVNMLNDLQKRIADICKDVDGNYTFVVRKNGQDVKVSIANTIRSVTAEPVEAPAADALHDSYVCKVKHITRSPRGTMSVTVNGKVFMEANGSDTMISVVEYIGVNKIKAIAVKNGIVSNKVPLISKTLDKKYAYSQHKLSTGEYLITHGGLRWKKEILEKLGSYLPDIDIKVELA